MISKDNKNIILLINKRLQHEKVKKNYETSYKHIKGKKKNMNVTEVRVKNQNNFE